MAANDNVGVTHDREALRAASADTTVTATRRALCVALADALGRAGEALFVSGDMVGDDRAAGRSPYGHGDDGVIACASLAQIAASLCAATASQLDVSNVYAAHALLRQLVETDYLMTLFAHDLDAAWQWLHATPEDRRKAWRPKQVRHRSPDVFSDRDYWLHCTFGGHPTAEAARVLIRRRHDVLTASWIDLARHSVHIWDELIGAADVRGHLGMLGPIGTDPALGLQRKYNEWKDTDRVPQIFAEILDANEPVS